MRRLATLIAPTLLAACAAATPASAVPDATLTRPPTLTAPVVAATRTPEPGFTLIPATPIPPTDTPAPYTNDAIFVADVTVPDNSQILPGAPIDKRWEVR